MFEKLLNKIGLYTEKQAYNIKLETIRKIKADFIQQNESLKFELENAQDEVNRVKGFWIPLYEEQKDLLNKCKEENEELKKELKKVKLKLARSLKRRKR